MADSALRIVQGKFPAQPIVAVPLDHPMPHPISWFDWMLSWIPDLSLVTATVWFGIGHWLNWFVLSPYPVKLGAALGAFVGPIVLVIRARESWHRGNLNRDLRREVRHRMNEPE